MVANEPQQQQEERKEVKLIQSPNDNNKYRYLKLKNDLEVVLVSDESTDQSSCCLAINIGSLCNPREIEGLAHFLEHMLFLGTEKFPVEKEFVNFIYLNGGTYNGTTSANKTNYYFTVNQESFEEALDRFSSFFISPLMNEDAVNRELNAVDSEHNNNMQKDHWRMDRIINDQFEGHPMSMFFTGDSSTLKRDDIREKVVEFYQSYYSANLMKVCIFGRESLDQLEEYANKYFLPIVNKDVKVPKLPPLTITSKSSIMIEAEPTQDMDLLKFVFPIPDEKLCFSKNYKSSSATILSHILGHECEGSLFSVLFNKDYAFSLSISSNSFYENMNKFEIQIHLTKTGLENVDEIIALLFQSFEFDTPEYFFIEKKILSEINWKSFQKSAPANTTQAITSNLFRVERPEDTLKYNNFLEKFEPQKIKEIQSYLRPDNMICLFYSSTKFKGKTTEIEPHYKIKFNKRYIDQTDYDKWKSFPKNTNLFVPKENPFLPIDTTIKAPQDHSIHIPKEVYNNNGVKVYHSLDHRFNSPKARVNIRFELTSYGNNQSMVMWNLLKKSLKEVLNEKILYYLSVLDFSMKLQILTTHVEFQCYSFNDIIFTALGKVFDFLMNLELNDMQFKRIKEKVAKRFLKSHHLSPYQISMRHLSLHTFNCNSMLLDKQDYLKKVTKSEFLNYFKSLFSYVNFSIMVVGNASVEDACAFGEKINSFTNRNSACPGDVFKLARVNLPSNTITHEKEFLYDANQTNCSSSISFLVGQFNRKTYATTLVISSILGSAYFEELRTKQQFGYVVNCASDCTGNAISMRCIVQSHTKTPEEIFDATMDFFVDFEKTLDYFKTNPSDFNDLIENCQKQNTVKQQSNSAQSSLYWNFFTFCGDFEFEKKKYEDIGKITFDDVKQYYLDHLSPKTANLRIFAAHCYPQSYQIPDDVKPFGNTKVNLLKKNEHDNFRENHGYLSSKVNL
ncbi:hypothetical protein ACTFIU_011555 [Dictyostelium citrinum]